MQSRNYDGELMSIGKEAEEIVIDWLYGRPNVSNIVDLRDNKKAQHDDIDILIEFNDARADETAEIKHDKHLGVSGNVLFETLRIRHGHSPDKAGRLGWSLRSPATWFLFYAPAVRQIWRCRPNDLRTVWQIYIQEARNNAQIHIKVTDDELSTLNTLIPVKYCLPIFEIFDVDK